ncbi:esterase/lipase family protein [Klenkia brasiliensis]|uniref:Alpha/beta hydrolase family protein n=1 Tax=Klenkia brasiliensis TaxID=333142 RepID=A0A1G7R8X5_9ACTN|nr:alpha/beta fold hydrolase [Klenkia brasiliensis]SDG07095.1 Alpha/beta hydrolase family protein [Klenkia brasiliensis]
MTTSASAPAWHGTPAVVASGASGVARAARTVRGLCTPSMLAGGLTELAWLSAHALLWPLGTRPETPVVDDRIRPEWQPPAVRALFAGDPLAARVPVVLVHGMVDNRSVFTVMSRALRRRGFTSVSTWNYSPLVQDVRVAARQLEQHLARVCEDSGHDRVHVVGHSLGGIVARWLLQCGGSERFASLTTLGSPHGGTIWAHAGPTPLIRQLRPGSDLMAELGRPAPGLDVPVTAVWSDLDQLVLPVSSGRCDHPDLQARNVAVHGVGHMSLPIHRGVVDEVAAVLAGHRAGTDADHIAVA